MQRAVVGVGAVAVGARRRVHHGGVEGVAEGVAIGIQFARLVMAPQSLGHACKQLHGAVVEGVYNRIVGCEDVVVVLAAARPVDNVADVAVETYRAAECVGRDGVVDAR